MCVFEIRNIYSRRVFGFSAASQTEASSAPVNKRRYCSERKVPPSKVAEQR